MAKNSPLAEAFLEKNNRFLRVSVAAALKSLTGQDLSLTTNYLTALDIFPHCDANETSSLIREAVESSSPYFVGRFGSTELRVIVKYINRESRNWPERIYAMIARFESPFWTAWEHRNIRTQSGFFPVDRRAIDEFSQLVIEDTDTLDILGSWVAGENKLVDHLLGAKVCDRRYLEPFWSEVPWTASLKGKRVLVVHPFVESIEAQFQRRDKLFDADSKILPDFHLITLKAPQTLGSNTDGFSSWFEALNRTKEEIDGIDFDVLIAGCGAYGFNLAAHAKRLGKIGIHLGGVTQILFGLRGRRWDRDPSYSELYNESWVHPSLSERPIGWKRVDSGIYW